MASPGSPFSAPVSTPADGPHTAAGAQVCGVPEFGPVRVRGRHRHRLRRCLTRRRRPLTAGLVLAAATLAVSGPRSGTEGGGRVDGDGAAAPGPRSRAPVGPAPAAMVSAPVRIADAAAVRLLRPGDRVDVLAASEERVGGPAARVIARGVRVARVPQPYDSAADGEGALVVLVVERRTATALVGASVGTRLAVTLC